VKRFLWSRRAALMGGLLLARQIAVAASTAFLTLIARDAAEGRMRALVIAAYLFSCGGSFRASSTTRGPSARRGSSPASSRPVIRLSTRPSVRRWARAFMAS
jgi:hypothetical protein